MNSWSHPPQTTIPNIQADHINTKMAYRINMLLIGGIMQPWCRPDWSKSAHKTYLMWLAIYTNAQLYHKDTETADGIVPYSFRPNKYNAAKHEVSHPSTTTFKVCLTRKVIQMLSVYNVDRLHTCTNNWFFVLGFLHGVRDKFSNDVSGPVKMGQTVAPKTSSENSPHTPCKNPKTKNQYSFQSESLKSRCMTNTASCIYQP
jgi:hypothetical protein